MTTLLLAPDLTLARMRVVVTAAAGGNLTRLDPDGVERPVRGGWALTGDSLVDDYELPLGVEVTYRLDGVEVTGRLDVAEPWLTHPTTPSLSMPVRLVDDDPYSWEAPGTVHEPIDSSWPVVVWSARTVHRGTLRVHTSWADRDRLKDLLRDGSPLLLRVPPACFADQQWIWVQRATRSKSRPYDPAYLEWELEYQRVDDPAGRITEDPSNAWAAVPVNHATWLELVAGHPDWVDVALTPHPHTPAAGP